MWLSISLIDSMGRSSYQVLCVQKLKIERQYNCFRCRILNHGQSMVCTAMLQPLHYTDEYEVEMIFSGKSVPKIYLKSPKIPVNYEIHMYAEGNLCLFYPPDFKWTESTSAADSIIPWINEWIVYYEIYKISGVWEGPAAPHLPGRNSKQ